MIDTYNFQLVRSLGATFSGDAFC